MKFFIDAGERAEIVDRAPIGSPGQVTNAAGSGLHGSLTTPTALCPLFKSPTTDNGRQAHIADWAKSGLSILGGEVRPVRRSA